MIDEELKIEIEEDEYQENIKKTSIPKLITYIHDSIQILITSKIELTKTQQRIEDEKFFSKNRKKYLPNSNEYDKVSSSKRDELN